MLQHKIYNKPNLRMIVEAMLYRMHVGSPWRDPPIELSERNPGRGRETQLYHISFVLMRRAMDNDMAARHSK